MVGEKTWISYSEISLNSKILPIMTTFCDSEGCNGTSLKAIRPISAAFLLSHLDSTGFAFWVGGDGVYNRGNTMITEFQRPALIAIRYL